MKDRPEREEERENGTNGANGANGEERKGTFLIGNLRPWSMLTEIYSTR